MSRAGRWLRATFCAERGSATVLVLAGLGALVFLMTAGLTISAAVLGAHRARAAADLGALAGALAVQRGETGARACERAVAVIERNQGRLVSCSAGPEGFVDVEVTARARGPLMLPGLGALEAKARSRAGPSPRGSVHQASSVGPLPMSLSATVRNRSV
jgi:secretion/DNA translocation related TadE-like protein